MNGKIINSDECKIHGLSYSLHYGVAAFEGIRFYETAKGVAVFRLNDHIKRLINSCSAIEIPVKYSQEELVKATKEIVCVSKLKSGYIRPIIFYGYGKLGLHAEDNEVHSIIAVLPWGKYLGNEAVKVMISSYIRPHPKSLPMNAKLSGYYVNSVFAVLEAKKHGYNEALLLDYNGNIAEGPGENFFIVKNGVIFTPPLGNILPGITRASIIRIARESGIKVSEKDFKVEEAKKADEAFFTGTAAEITPINQIDKTMIGDGKVGTVTSKLKDIFYNIVTGKNKDYEEWVDYI